MRAVALVVRPDRPAAAELAAIAGRWWGERGYEVLSLAEETPRGPLLASDGAPVDFAISLGGDGTMLRTIDLACSSGVPVLGVNLGRLGYLTEVEPTGLEAAFERLISGDLAIEERMTLAVDARRKGQQETHLVALNEAVIEKTSPGHTVRIATSIAGRPFMTYAADGLLVSTPTGSTAYNLSVRGPIVSPRLRAMVLTPIAPHVLFDRSLVVEPDEWLELELLDGREAALVVDGSTVIGLAPGDSVTVRLGAYPARIVTFGTRDFHAILRAKFGLTDR